MTGGTGMVGRNLQAHVRAGSHDVMAPPRSELDLLDEDEVSAWVAGACPEIVIHAAGKVGGIRANMEDPLNFMDVNMRIGRNVLMAAWRANVPRLINLASSCFYPARAQNPLREDQILTGPCESTNEGYALAKILVMRMGYYISRQNPALSYKTLIPCNLYGPWDDFSANGSHMLPAAIAKIHGALMAGDEEVEIWGDGTARREFMYAEDVADGIWAAVEQFDRLPEVMNLGVGADRTINEYYAAAARVIGWTGSFVHNLECPVGMKSKLLDITRQSVFGWSPQYTLEEGIAKTYAHYLEHDTA
ncbi:MAG: NAD-dependent epimerase/dehydratase family protein [Rhodobacteraceae bacterium]|nr:NAD-dependent epimerase/dehydratase family protein [Paracoccaceae bacterium]